MKKWTDKKYDMEYLITVPSKVHIALRSFSGGLTRVYILNLDSDTPYTTFGEVFGPYEVCKQFGEQWGSLLQEFGAGAWPMIKKGIDEYNK